MRIYFKLFAYRNACLGVWVLGFAGTGGNNFKYAIHSHTKPLLKCMRETLRTLHDLSFHWVRSCNHLGAMRIHQENSPC